MVLTTLSRKFLPVAVIEGFESAIWTERYYGDSEVQLVVPATPSILQELAIGTFLSIDESKEVMILETHDIQNNRATITGISLLKWLNNRFIRATANHEDRYWNIEGVSAGFALWFIIHGMCVTGVFPAGIPNPGRLKINNLWNGPLDNSGGPVSLAVPYGPIYDALYTIATTYQLGMSITLEDASETSYRLEFKDYRGVDRTSIQTLNPLVRFSPDMESLTNIKELQSIAGHKTEVYSFAPANPDGLATTPGIAWNSDVTATQFDLRAAMTFEEDLTTDVIGGDAGILLNILFYRAFEALYAFRFAKIIDGEIVPTGQYEYGVDYNLGDIIEIQGHSGIINAARVVEYIRSKDSVGEKAYPTLEMLG